METVKRLTILFFLILFFGVEQCSAFQEPPVVLPHQELVWLSLEKGMDMACLSYGGENSANLPLVIRVLRFDTAFFDFILCSARWERSRPRNIREWAELRHMSAAINAGMYQTDGLTSTGYMRRGELVNNARVVRRYGSFFVSGPRSADLPRAAVLDRERDDWQRLLPQYDIVIQNFRLMGPGGRQLWPKDGPRHAIAAIAEDLHGHILFLHCQQPVSVYEFVEALTAHDGLHLDTAMYMEGGSEATLALRISNDICVWSGNTPASYMFPGLGNDSPIPSVLGVVPR